jgi:F-type H+-transporting ATPase subunit alpha
MSLDGQIIIIYAGTNGFADQVPLEQMRAWEVALLRFMERSYPEVGRDIIEKKRLTDENTARLRSALDAFKETWQ